MQFQWGTALYSLLMFILMIGIPVAIISFFLTRRQSKINELEQRVERLERVCDQNEEAPTKSKNPSF